MDESRKKKPSEENPAGPAGNRRRIGMIVHDDRGMGSVEWHDAPADEDRPVLEILGSPGLTLKNDNTYDPYARHKPASKPSSGTTTRTNLRKLSEWIKMKRELEERKLRGDVVDDDDEKD